jgi:hypothetical protein
MASVEEKIKEWLAKKPKKIDSKEMPKILSPYTESRQLKENMEMGGDAEEDIMADKIERLIMGLNNSSLTPEQAALKNEILDFFAEEEAEGEDWMGDNELKEEPQEDMSAEFGPEPMLDPEPEEVFNKYEGTDPKEKIRKRIKDLKDKIKNVNYWTKDSSVQNMHVKGREKSKETLQKYREQIKKLEDQLKEVK